MVDSMFTSAYDGVVQSLVRLRKSAGLSQRQLAEELGREQNFVGRVETGQRRVDLVEFIWICRACKADPEAEMMALLKNLRGRVPARPAKRRRR
jgi:transcriptional regulator with XRE-family HTH domain